MSIIFVRALYQSRTSRASLLEHMCRHISTTERPVKEIQIPTDWGFISGKWWGKDDSRPLLALHGWQDNAGSWNTLIPYLPKDQNVLAVDLPGHGKSSWFPKGMHYSPPDWIKTIDIIKQYFKWDKISFMSHSMGSIASMRYSALFPDNVDLYIAFENLILEKYPIDNAISRLSKALTKLSFYQQHLYEEPPSYPYEEAIKRWHIGTKKSVALNTAHNLVDRGSRQSQSDPKKYYFSRDPRLKTHLFPPESEEYTKGLSLRLKCPILYIKATESDFATDDLSVYIRDLIAKNNEKFECHFVPGTHHVHLNTPDVVAPLIVDFLERYTVSEALRAKL